MAVMVYGQDQNYVKTTVYRQPSSAPLENPTQQQAAVEINYLDGLGRPLQRRAYRQSGTGTDLVTHFAYDAFGRQAREYLPYPTQSASLTYDSAAEAGITAFYGTTPSPSTGMETTQNPYREFLYENSHLNRVLRQAAPGNAWSMGSGHEVRMAYDTNTADDGVKKYTAVTTLNSTTLILDVSLATADYEPGQLYKNITRNENWTSGLDNTVEEFTDKEGRLVLRRAYEAGQRHDTYYVYDEFGNLSYVFPPLANNPAAQLDDLCYQYKYDQRNRIAEKKLPGRQWQYLVYDRLDRLVATGPARSPFDGAQSGWLITKYDAFGRVAYTGWYQNSDSRKTVQQQVSASLNLYEIRAFQTIDNISVGYSNKVFPTSGMNVLSVSWYDDYSYPGAPTTFGTVEGQTVFYNNTTEKPKGLPTGSWTRTLEGATAYRGELTGTLYDIKGRPISVRSTNYMGGHSVTESKLDFSGRSEYTVTRNQRTNSDTEYSTREDFAYDPQDRLLSHTHKIGSLPTELLSLNSYDQLGKLVSKKTGGNDLSGSTFYQKVDYSYNIRGWLKGINSIENFATDDGGKDLFAFAIRYNDLTQAYDPTLKALYNGNISETRWISRSDSRERSYSYSYDALDRLRNAAYFKDRSYTKSYDESMEYDRNGNIVHMVRFGDLDYSGYIIQIDELDYTYGNGNRLKKVNDNSIHPAGFRDGVDIAEEYTYDANGNMVSDENKGIGTITYNHMDLPIEINFRSGSKINYLYDASGTKLRKTVLDGTTSTVTDYLSGFQYINTVLDLFHTAEGYVKHVPATRLRPAQFNYVFNIKDHLGNIRVSYAMNKEKGVLAIMEESHYYPFGLKHEKYNSDQYEFVEISEEVGGYMVGIEPLGPQQRRSYQYKYQGQERQDELGLNWDSFKWRNYDFALGRFMSVDPLAESYSYQSPYNFAENRVVDGNELEGLEWAPTADKQESFEDRLNRGMLTGAAERLTDYANFAVTVVTDPGTALKQTGGAIGNAVGATIGLIQDPVGSFNGTAQAMQTKMKSSADPVDGMGQFMGSILTDMVSAEAIGAGFARLFSAGSKAGVVESTSTNKTVTTSKPVNGNSKTSTKAQHLYEIYEIESTNVVKTGVSGGKISKAGKSYRATSQVNKLNKAAGSKKYDSRIVEKVAEGKGARKKILDAEKKNADKNRKTLDPAIHKTP
ncbi:RHS repeat-associated core domain [Sphingobacterium multivorum]|nr:RHS repeat-associated core domain [Sphingobacterium multivorum]